MKRWASWILAIGLLIGLFSTAQAELGPADISYGGTSYQIHVTDTSFGGAEGGKVTISAPEGQYLVRFMNNDEDVGMTPVEGVTLEVNQNGAQFFTAALVDLEIDNQSVPSARSEATIDGVTFYYDTQAIPTALYIRSVEGGPFVRLTLEGQKAEEPAPIEKPAMPDVRFTVLGTEYHVMRLENVPTFQRENLMDGVEGHAILFGYESGEGFEEANLYLYSNAKLIAPNGAEIRTYSNSGNVENPYTLYFGLPDGVMLEDCTLRIIKETGDEYYPLGEAPVSPLPTEAPASEPVFTEPPAEEPVSTEAPMEVPAAINAPGTDEITLYFEDKPIVGYYGGAAMDDERNLMGVSFYCPDMDSHIKVESTDDGLSIIVPVRMNIIADGEMLEAVDGTFFRNEVLWFFDTDRIPDTISLYPHGADTDVAAHVIVDGATGLIIDPDAVVPPAAEVDPTPEPLPTEAPVDESEPEPTPTPVPDNTPEPEPEPEPTAEPSAGLLANVNDVLKALADETDNPWQKAIYEAGVENIREEGGVASFSLRSFYPGLKELGDYEKDKNAWMEGFSRNVQAYDLAASLDFSGGVNPTDDSLKALKSEVGKAADSAKSEFDQKAVRIAIAEFLLPSPAASLKDADDLFSLSEAYYARTEALSLDIDSERFYAPLFYAQSSQVMSVSGGPHALVLSCKGVDSAQLLKGAREQVLSDLSKRYKANQMDEYEIEEYFLKELVARAESIRKKSVDSYDFTLDIDGLLNGNYGPSYMHYINSYDCMTALGEIAAEVWAMPDAPAQDFPKSGRISGSKSGTKVIIKAPDDGDGRYVQMRTSDGDEVKVDMFIRSGGSATVYVSKGMYYLMVASGETWYGVEGLFGDYGSYSMTSETEILGSSYYHTIELRTAEEGNMSSYGADMSDFFG